MGVGPVADPLSPSSPSSPSSSSSESAEVYDNRALFATQMPGSPTSEGGGVVVVSS